MHEKVDNTRIKIKAVCATDALCLEVWGGKSRFTREAIRTICREAPGKPILLEFNNDRGPIGFITKSFIEDSGRKVIIEAGIHKEYLSVSLYAVPAFIVDKDEWDEQNDQLIREIKDIKLVSVGFVTQPIDLTLTPVKEI